MAESLSLSIRCDNCGSHSSPVHVARPVKRGDVEQLRAAIAPAGWARFRTKSDRPNGDYCPRCVPKLLRSKAAAQEAES